MKKLIGIILITIVLTLGMQNVITQYFINNLYFGCNVSFGEQEYPQYADKYMGMSGYVKNNTLVPVKIKRVTPIGGRGLEYFTTVIKIWGLSEADIEEIREFEELHNKVIDPKKSKDLAMFYKFTGEYAVNPAAYEVVYSVLGFEFKKVVK